MAPPPSSRERALWIGTGLTVAAIYISIPFAGTLSEALRSSGLLAPAFALCFVLAIALTVGRSVWGSRAPRAFWVAAAVVTVWGMLFVRMGVTAEERSHLFEYGLLGLLILELLMERRRTGRPAPAPVITAVLSTAALGWIDEGIQAVVPGRVYDLRDVGVNALAGAVAVLSSMALRWATKGRDVAHRDGSAV